MDGWRLPLLVVSLPLNCLQVIRSSARLQSALNNDQSLVENESNQWDIFRNYHPDFKMISRVSKFKF